MHWSYVILALTHRYDITTTKQTTTKPSAYFMGYTPYWVADTTNCLTSPGPFYRHSYPNLKTGTLITSLIDFGVPDNSSLALEFQ